MDGWMDRESQNQEAFYLRIYVTTEIKGKQEGNNFIKENLRKRMWPLVGFLFRGSQV